MKTLLVYDAETISLHKLHLEVDQRTELVRIKLGDGARLSSFGGWIEIWTKTLVGATL